MLIKKFVASIIFLFCASAKANINMQTTCYTYVPQGNTSPIRLILRTYIDTDLKKEVGSFVQYNNSKEIIPLVFAKHSSTDTESPDLGNYEILRIEVSKNKVSGEYTAVQSGAGIRQGKYIRYTNHKTGKSTTFMATGDEDDFCKINK